MRETCEQMKQYIARTKMNPRLQYGYELTVKDIRVFWEMWQKGQPFEMIGMLFHYGMAKGYRMAKAETTRKRKREEQKWQSGSI